MSNATPAPTPCRDWARVGLRSIVECRFDYFFVIQMRDEQLLRKVEVIHGPAASEGSFLQTTNFLKTDVAMGNNEIACIILKRVVAYILSWQQN